MKPKRHWQMAGATLLIAVAVLTGCTPPGVTVSKGPRETTVIGRFDGEPRDDAGCAWIQTNSGERVEVVYPNGWHVAFDPLALFDANGHKVAAAGDSILVEGYFNDVGASLCSPQRSFAATTVTVRD